MKKHIPNALTCANLLSGCIGVVFAFKGELDLAAYAVIISGIFDFFDGFAARLLHVKSAIGKELDSLADMVSFGMLPGVVMFQLLAGTGSAVPYLPYLGFMITVCSALRLAKFNIDTRQTEDFIGLNTPMNTFFIISLPFIREEYPSVINSPAVLIILTLVMSLLLVSELRLFSLKFGSLGWAENKVKFIFLFLSAVLVAFFQFTAVPLILLLYISASALHFGNRPGQKITGSV
jgi:CDP-diacylglycerol--serine O-phosphatidyltransferase